MDAKVVLSLENITKKYPGRVSPEQCFDEFS